MLNNKFKRGIRELVATQIIEQTQQAQIQDVTEMDALYTDADAMKLNCDDVREILEIGGELIDVRSPKDYVGSKLHKSRNIPLQHVLKETTGWEKNIPIIIYSNDGMKSHIAKERLITAGFSNVNNIGRLSWYDLCS